MIDLNTMPPRKSGWELVDVFLSDERGLVVGGGTRDGHLHAYMLALH
jgi:hypothetical protein